MAALLRLRRSALRSPATFVSWKSNVRTFSDIPISSTVQSPTEASVDGEKWIKLMQTTSKLEASTLLPLNEKLLGPLDRKNKEEKLPSLPFVFLLGNHSSGKSTFINYLLDREIQNTGVAPTDDGFTIIAPGSADLDQDGPALVGDPDLGFTGLRSYGPALIQRTQLKVRNGIKSNFMLVDSPGMIDSPQRLTPPHAAISDSYSSKLNAGHQYRSNDSSSDRGYEFPEVVRWYAERADVILLFFDPDKPGTTGETLSILTRSLVGMDHKLHIVLNKVDQFQKLHDFARAYGSLCWNLSKVIPLKDLPRIYTMCIPQASNLTPSWGSSGGMNAASMKDLDVMREELVSEVQRAPERRVDNLITNLYDATRLLHMHATIYEDLRTSYAKEKNRRYMLLASTFIGGNALAASGLAAGMAMEVAAGVSFTSILLSGFMLYQNSSALSQLQKDLLHENSLSEVFKRRYGRQLAEGDEYAMSVWERVKPSLQVAFHTLGFNKMPKVKKGEIDALENILEQEIPDLRRRSAPEDSSLAHRVAKMFRN